VFAAVIETEVRIKANGEDGREGVFRQQGVAERQQRVDRVAWRAPITGLEVKSTPWHRAAEHPPERTKIGTRRLSLEAEEDAGIWCLVKACQHAGHLDGGRLIAASDGGLVVLTLRTERAHQQRTLVGDLGFHHGL